MASGFEALPVQPLHFERPEQCLAAGVVPTVAAPAHRAGDAVLLQDISEILAGVLAASDALLFVKRSVRRERWSACSDERGAKPECTQDAQHIWPICSPSSSATNVD